MREEKGACDAGPCECGGGGGRLWKNVRGASFVAVCPPMLHNVAPSRRHATTSGSEGVQAESKRNVNEEPSRNTATVVPSSPLARRHSQEEHMRASGK